MCFQIKAVKLILAGYKNDFTCCRHIIDRITKNLHTTNKSLQMATNDNKKLMLKHAKIYYDTLTNVSIC